MPKTRQQKQQTVETLSNGLKQAKSVVFANFQGLKVSEVEQLRKTCRVQAINVVAAKKTLLKKACQSIGLSEVDPVVFSGSVASFFGDNEVSPAKTVNDFALKHEVVSIFGGLLEGKYINATEVKNLATLPSKPELLSKLVGTLQAPVSGFVNVLAGNLRNLVSVLNNIKEVKV